MGGLNPSTNYNYIFLWFGFAGFATVLVFGTVTVPLKRMYASLQSHKIDFNIEVLDLTWLLVLYVPCESSLTSTQFSVLIWDDWFGVLSNKFIIVWYSIVMLLY